MAAFETGSPSLHSHLVSTKNPSCGQWHIMFRIFNLFASSPVMFMPSWLQLANCIQVIPNYEKCVLGLPLAFGSVIANRSFIRLKTNPFWCWFFNVVLKLHRKILRHQTIDLFGRMEFFKTCRAFYRNVSFFDSNLPFGIGWANWIPLTHTVASFGLRAVGAKLTSPKFMSIFCNLLTQPICNRTRIKHNNLSPPHFSRGPQTRSD